MVIIWSITVKKLPATQVGIEVIGIAPQPVKQLRYVSVTGILLSEEIFMFISLSKQYMPLRSVNKCNELLNASEKFSIAL